jgi:hypothetical protein
METATSIFGGIVGLIVLIFLIVLFFFWILFPMVIYFKLSAIEKHLAKMNLDGDNQYNYSAAKIQEIANNTAQTAVLLGARTAVITPPLT